MVFGFDIRRPGEWTERETGLPDATKIREAAKKRPEKYVLPIKNASAVGRQHYYIVDNWCCHERTLYQKNPENNIQDLKKIGAGREQSLKVSDLMSIVYVIATAKKT